MAELLYGAVTVNLRVSGIFWICVRILEKDKRPALPPGRVKGRERRTSSRSSFY